MIEYVRDENRARCAPSSNNVWEGLMDRRQVVFRSFVHSSFLLFSAYVFCGCTVLGFGTGAMIDSGKPDKEILLPEGAPNLGSGDDVRISLVDSSFTDGTYEGKAYLDSSVYAARYAKFRQSMSSSTTFPNLGDTLRATLKPGKSQMTYLFCGFDLKSMDVQVPGQPNIGKMPFRRLSTLESKSGENLQPDMLESMSTKNQLPHNISLLVRTKHDTIHVPYDDIRFIEKANSKNAKWIGLGVGFVIDAVAIISISNALSHIGGGMGNMNFN